MRAARLQAARQEAARMQVAKLQRMFWWLTTDAIIFLVFTPTQGCRLQGCSLESCKAARLRHIPPPPPPGDVRHLGYFENGVRRKPSAAGMHSIIWWEGRSSPMTIWTLLAPWSSIRPATLGTCTCPQAVGIRTACWPRPCRTLSPPDGSLSSTASRRPATTRCETTLKLWVL
jgi:hypothetical protein